MTVLLCFLLPPVFLMYVREKVLGGKIKCSFHGEVKDFLKEYLLSICFLNFIVIAVTYKLFHHEGVLDAALMNHTVFAFHYLLLSLFIAAIEPVLENLLRYHLRVETKKKKTHVNINLMLYVYAFVLFLMNFVRVFDNTFWGDEGFSIRLAQMSVGEMITATASDVHPPLYYILVQMLYHVFGNNGIAYHLSALIPYAVIVIIGCTVVRKCFGVIPAAILITMSSLMKNAVTYNVEVRMYALAAMFVLIAYVAFYGVIKNNRLKSWVIFCISALAAAYTHYYALISVAFLYAMIIPLAILQKKYRRGTVIAYIATILGYLPWLVILVNSFGRTASNWWLASIPKVSDCYTFLLDYKWLAACSLVCFLLFAVYQANFLNISVSKEKKWEDCVDINVNLSHKIGFNSELYWIISGVISVCGTAAVGLILSYAIRPLFITRYLFPVSAVLYLIIGICASKMKLRKLWCVVLVVAILWNNVPSYAQCYQTDYQLNSETEKFLDAVKPEDDAQLVTNNIHMGWTLLQYYYPENNSKYDGNAPTQLDTGYKDIWLIWDGALDETAETDIRKQHYTSTKIYEGFFANEVYYYVYQLRQNK